MKILFDVLACIGAASVLASLFLLAIVMMADDGDPDEREERRQANNDNLRQ